MNQFGIPSFPSMYDIEIPSNELFQGGKLLLLNAMEKVSIRSILSTSYAAGGIYPTLVGYAIGAVLALCISVSGSIIYRFGVSILTLLFFSQCFVDYERAFAVLLSVGAVTGVCCTYVQVLSWKLAFSHIATKREEKRRTLRKKVD